MTMTMMVNDGDGDGGDGDGDDDDEFGPEVVCGLSQDLRMQMASNSHPSSHEDK